MSDQQPRIASVKPLLSECSLLIEWENGKRDRVNLSSVIDSREAMQTLRQQESFNSVEVIDWGWGVGWLHGDDIGMSAARLYQLAVEQKRQQAEAFRQWRVRHHLTMEMAARELGISRRSVAYYESGQRPLPRTVALACKGWEAEHRR